MTVQELYDWAKENNCLDYEIKVDCDFDCYMRKVNYLNKVTWAKEIEIK